MYNQQPQQFKSTKLGKVSILKKNQPIPNYYRYLNPDQCHWIKYQIMSIVYQLLENNPIALSSGTFRNYGFDLQINQQTDNSQCQYFLIISPNNSSVSISHFDQITQLIKKNQYVFLPIGLVLKVSLFNPIPDGFRKMTIKEGTQYQQSLIRLLSTWSIVAFQTGKIDGQGYGNNIEQSYGSQCGQVFVISVAPI